MKAKPAIAKMIWKISLGAPRRARAETKVRAARVLMWHRSKESPFRGRYSRVLAMISSCGRDLTIFNTRAIRGPPSLPAAIAKVTATVTATPRSLNRRRPSLAVAAGALRHPSKPDGRISVVPECSRRTDDPYHQLLANNDR